MRTTTAGFLTMNLSYFDWAILISLRDWLGRIIYRLQIEPKINGGIFNRCRFAPLGQSLQGKSSFTGADFTGIGS